MDGYLNNVMDMAFVKYIKKSFPSEDIKNIEQRFERERKKYDDDFDNIKRKTLIITAEIEYSIMTIFPDFLKYPSLEKLGASHNKALVIEEAIGYLQNRHPFNEKAFLALSRLIRNKTPENKRFEKIIKDTLDNKLDFNEIFGDIEEIKVKKEIEKQKRLSFFF